MKCATVRPPQLYNKKLSDAYGEEALKLRQRQNWLIDEDTKSFRRDNNNNSGTRNHKEVVSVSSNNKSFCFSRRICFPFGKTHGKRTFTFRPIGNNYIGNTLRVYSTETSLLSSTHVSSIRVSVCGRGRSLATHGGSFTNY